MGEDALHFSMAGVTDPLASLRDHKLAALQAGKDVIDLSMFNPDLTPQRLLLDKLVEASTKPHLHRYAVSRGVRKLREAFSNKYRQRFEVILSPEEEVCVTLGSKDALLQTLGVLTKPGDTVLCVEPLYPSFRSALAVSGAKLLSVALSPSENELAASIEKALKTAPVKLILLNFPHNPTGRVVSQDFWDRIVSLAREYQCHVFNDFVYGELVHDGSAAPSLLRSEGARACCIESYSLSKAYSVPGWRVAAVLGNAQIVGAIASRKSTLDFGIFLPVQIAAAAALESGPSISRVAVEEYRSRAKALCAVLEKVGCVVEHPAAGGCVWARLPSGVEDALRCSGGEMESRPIEELLLEKTGIVVAPGWYYGARQQGDGAAALWSSFVRFALVAPRERLREVGARMGALT